MVVVESNRDGFRDRDYELDKSEGVFRILVLGDSYTEGRQVAAEHRFTNRLEERLRDDGVHAEVMNYGLSGYGTAQELEVLKHFGPIYRPDLVLVAFLHHNDIRNNAASLEPDRVRPFYRLHADGRLEVAYPDPPSPGWGKRLLRNVRLLYFIRDRLERLNAGYGRGNLVDNLQGTDPQALEAAKAIPPQFRRSTPPRFRKAERLTQRLLAEMASVAREIGATFAMALLPSVLELRHFRGQGGFTDARYDGARPFRVFRAFAEQEGILCIDLRPALAEGDAPMDRLFVPVDGHFSKQGHARTAKALFEALSHRIPLPEKAPGGSR